MRSFRRWQLNIVAAIVLRELLPSRHALNDFVTAVEAMSPPLRVSGVFRSFSLVLRRSMATAYNFVWPLSDQHESLL